jgi:enoyl-CoA hydratase
MLWLPGWTLAAASRKVGAMGTVVSYQLDSPAAGHPIATITVDDGKVNALSPEVLAELGAAFDRAEADRAVVVLTGRPGVFSAGFDLRVLRAGGPSSVDMVRSGFELAARVLTFPAPVVAACTGHAVAMGVFLLLAADYRIGAEGPFRLTANEVAIGLAIPVAAIEICRYRLAPAHVSRVVALAEPYGPGDAVAAGFLDRVVPEPELSAAAVAVAARLAALDLAAHPVAKQRLAGPAAAAIRADLAAAAAGLRA